MGKGYLCGSPFHIINTGDIARNSVYCTKYNPYIKAPPKVETTGHLPCLYSLSCRYGKYQYCTRKHYDNFQCFYPDIISDEAKIEIAGRFKKNVSAGILRALIQVYSDNNKKSITFKRKQDFDEYIRKLNKLMDISILYAKSKNCTDQLIAAWRDYLIQFQSPEIEILIATNLDPEALINCVLIEGDIPEKPSLFKFALMVERIAAERIMKLDNIRFIFDDEKPKKRRKKRRRNRNVTQ